METCADELAKLVEALDLKEAMIQSGIILSASIC